MIKIYSRNLLDQSSVTVSSENLLFPKSNIFHPFRTKVFRSTESETTLLFDLGETSEVDSVLIVDDKRNGFGFTGAKIQLNGGTDFTAPAFEQEITINQKHHFAHAEFEVQSYRYARLVLESTLNYCEVSGLFIGKAIHDEEMNISLGWAYADKELSKIIENRYGQKFIDVLSVQKELTFSLNTLNQDELDLVFDLYDRNGTTKPFFVKLGSEETTSDPDRFAGMFYMASKPKIINRHFGLYDISLTLEEAM